MFKMDFCSFPCRFDQHAQIDLPTMLDYVLNVTGKDKLYYVGHSQGTIMGFAGFTFNQSLAKHIEVFFALAPVTTVKHIKGLFKVMADFRKPIAVSCYFWLFAFSLPLETGVIHVTMNMV